MKPILFNHGLFQEELYKILEELHNEKKLEKEPYKQVVISEKICLCEKIFAKYKKTVEEQIDGTII